MNEEKEEEDSDSAMASHLVRKKAWQILDDWQERSGGHGGNVVVRIQQTVK